MFDYKETNESSESQNIPQTSQFSRFEHLPVSSNDLTDDALEEDPSSEETDQLDSDDDGL